MTVTTSTPVSDLAPSVPETSMATGVSDAFSHMRKESLESVHDFKNLAQRKAADPLAESRAALRPGPAANQTPALADRTIKSFEVLSQMSWRLVTFDVGSAALQKTDKSVKMFIQAQ